MQAKQQIIPPQYTVKDYYKWGDNPRMELINGYLYMMSPAPKPSHQEVIVKILRQIDTYLEGKKCKVYGAPIDVCFAKHSIVQPDVTIICDPKKTENNFRCEGAPDMIAEVLSPSTKSKDETEKLALYERFGVREYWIVDPIKYTVKVFLLRDGEYMLPPVKYSMQDRVKVDVLDDCYVDLNIVFSGLVAEPTRKRSRPRRMTNPND